MFEGLLQPTHLILILIIVLIVFGPGKLPDIGSALGKSIREFRNSTKDDEATVKEETKVERTTTPSGRATTKEETTTERTGTPVG